MVKFARTCLTRKNKLFCSKTDPNTGASPSQDRARREEHPSALSSSSALFFPRQPLRSVAVREIGNLLPTNQHQRRTCYALCHILYPVSAAHTSIFRMDSNSTSYPSSSSSALLSMDGIRRPLRLKMSDTTLSAPYCTRCILRVGVFPWKFTAQISNAIV